MFNEVTAAKYLMELDATIREWAEEDEIDTWLIYGVPDGTRSWQELLPLEEEDYDEMARLGRKIISRAIKDMTLLEVEDGGW